MQVVDVEKEIISEFEMFDNWMEKYEYLIELGKDLPLISSNHKNDENIIKGCQSKVWLHAEYENDLVSFYADSEAIITKGIIALLIRVLNNQTPKNILEAKLNFINEIGLTNHLSPTRANGLVEMVKQIKAYAYSLRIKNNLNN